MKKKKKTPITPSSVVDYAFHMPITADEECEFLAIRRKVFADTYLSEGYRTSKCNEKTIHNLDDYIAPAWSELPRKSSTRIVWTDEIIQDLREHFHNTPTKVFAEKYNINISSISVKAAEIGLAKSPEYIRSLRGANATKKLGKY